MNEIETHRYDYLRRSRYVVHEERERFIRPETLMEMREYEAVEFYTRERIRELSQKGLIKDELKARIESGPGARPMKSTWVESIYRQCREKNVPFFFKQWGGVQKRRTGRELFGRTFNEMPNPIAA